MIQSARPRVKRPEHDERKIVRRAARPHLADLWHIRKGGKEGALCRRCRELKDRAWTACSNLVQGHEEGPTRPLGGSCADGVGHLRASGAHRLRRAGRGISRGLVFNLGVQLRAE